jgi:hypothetical protein
LPWIKQDFADREAFVRGKAEDFYDLSQNWVSGPPNQQPEQQRIVYAQQLDNYTSLMMNLANMPMSGRRWW